MVGPVGVWLPPLLPPQRTALNVSASGRVSARTRSLTLRRAVCRIGGLPKDTSPGGPFAPNVSSRSFDTLFASVVRRASEDQGPAPYSLNSHNTPSLPSTRGTTVSIRPPRQLATITRA